jgi:hypothetical protein
MNDISCQAGTSTRIFPTYSAGLLLEDEDLTAGVEYTRNLSRLLFRSLFGCGVICGLEVGAAPICNGKKLQVTVSCGVALDCKGDPIEVPKDIVLEFDPDCDPFPERIWVVLCHTDTCCRPKETGCASDPDGPMVKTRVREGFKLALHAEEPSDVCQCGETKDDMACECGCGGGCGDCVLLATLPIGEGVTTLKEASIKSDISKVRHIRPANPCKQDGPPPAPTGDQPTPQAGDMPISELKAELERARAAADTAEETVQKTLAALQAAEERARLAEAARAEAEDKLRKTDKKPPKQ